MTTIAILSGDWEYEFEDETVGSGVAGTRRLNYIAGAVRTTLSVYSALAEAVDDFQATGFKNPMLPVTPNAFTMENQSFISRASTEFLKEGTISADWALTSSPDTDGNGITKVGYTIGVDFVTGDIGRQVTQAGTGHTGTLLDFEVEPNGDLVAWIRGDDSSTDTFSGTGALTVGGGTGSTTDSVVGVAGTMQYTAIQAIGSVPQATDVYIAQSRIKLANSADAAGFQFWDTDADVSLGIISVLIRTTNAGSVIQGGDLEVFARKYGSLYDNFRLNVAAGGFSALPLASAPDINNTTGYRTTGTLSGVTGTFTVGQGIYVGASWAAATVKGVITETNGNAELEYYLVGDLTDFSNTQAIQEYDFDTGLDGDADATTGTIANTDGSPTDSVTGGANVTFTIGHLTADFDNTGVAEPYSIQVNCDAKATGIVYEAMKYACRRGSDNSFWNTVASSIPGEQYRGLEALAYFDANTGTLVQGEDLLNETQTAQAMRLMALNDPFAGEGVGQDYVTLADLQPSTVSLANNDILADSGSTDDITVDTDGAGGSIVSITSPKSSPFGTYTGTQIFGAQGIHFTNLGAGDAQNYILTDDLGVPRNPPNTISFTIANTRAGDRLYAARDTGSAGVIDKDQFGGMAATSASATAIVVGTTIDGQVPAVGFVRVVENTLEQEHKYYYSSRSTTTFTLQAVTPGTADATTSSILLVDAAADFVTDNVQVGMLIQDTANTGTYEVVTVTDLNNLVIRHLYGADLFASGDTYEINETIQAYSTGDDIFDLIIDVEENTGTDGTPGAETNTLVKVPAADFGVVVQVRQGKIILPFELNQNQGDGNTTVTAVRTPDNIAV